MPTMKELGFGPFFSEQCNEGDQEHFPARVGSVERGSYSLMTTQGRVNGQLSGRFEYVAVLGSDYPTVGDWVWVRRQGELHIIERVLQRRSSLVRSRVGGSRDEQLIAANIDFVLVVQSCNEDFSQNRLERYLAAVADSDAKPVVVLNKSDLDGVGTYQFLREGVACHRVSAKEGDIDALSPYLGVGSTAVLVGSSGVGKSTLINELSREANQKTQDVREDDAKGRHTTTSRQIFRSRFGGWIIDTPGMREFGLAESDVQGTGLFDDIEELKRMCRFSRCTHTVEPECALQLAIESGDLEPGRLASYEKLLREEAHRRRQADPRLQANTKQKWKKITKQMRKRPPKGSY